MCLLLHYHNKSYNKIIFLAHTEMQEIFGAQQGILHYPQLLTIEAQKQKLKCPNKIQAFSVCIDSKCQIPGLMCRDPSCQCINTHYKCHHIQLNRVLDSIQRHQKQVPQEARRSYKVTNQIIHGMIEQLSKIFKKLQLEERYFGLTQQELSFMSLIDDQKIENICGKAVSELEKTFESEVAFYIKSHEEIISDFKLKRPEFDSLRKHVENSYTKYDLKKTISKFLSDSKIVYEINEKKIMYEWISQTPNKRRLQTKLIFRASEHNFSIAEFHKHCDGFDNTIVIAKNEFGKVIGGYNPNKWQSEGGCVNDKTGKAFLFSLSLKEKYKCVIPTDSVYNEKTRGPTFSGYVDFCLQDNANNKDSSYANFPRAYNLQVNGVNKYSQNQQTYTLFTGATNGNRFKVEQYQIYQIKQS